MLYTLKSAEILSCLHNPFTLTPNQGTLSCGQDSKGLISCQSRDHSGSALTSYQIHVGEILRIQRLWAANEGSMGEDRHGILSLNSGRLQWPWIWHRAAELLEAKQEFHRPENSHQVLALTPEPTDLWTHEMVHSHPSLPITKGRWPCLNHLHLQRFSNFSACWYHPQGWRKNRIYRPHLQSFWFQ